MSWGYCPKCLKKQRRIDELEEEIVRLKAKLRYQERTVSEGVFGSSTPSAKLPVKPNSLQERQGKHGGAKVGHKGHGRKTFTEAEADRVQTVRVPARCPDCGTTLEAKKLRRRCMLDVPTVKVEKVLWRLDRKWCPHCRRAVSAHPPGILPKSLYSNRLLAYLAVQHYVYGIPVGTLVRQTGLLQGGLLKAFHRLARLIGSVPERLLQDYRASPVKHADETGWRTDGQNGYAWLFCTSKLSLFRFRQSRSAQIAQQVLGCDPSPGVLVVDRYHAYNKAPSHLQYCYAHLLRDVQDIEKTFPNDSEVLAFVHHLAPLLAKAMKLRTLPLSRQQFRRRARRLKTSILKIAHRNANHPAIWNIQEIFRTKTDRLFHWARDPSIPADNNLAERELRPLVIARKISFGSQSPQGARTRETMMSVLNTIAKRTPQVAQTLELALNALAQNPYTDLYPLLFPTSPANSNPHHQ